MQEAISLDDLPGEGEFITDDEVEIKIGTEHIIGPHTLTCCMVAKGGHTRICTKTDLHDAVEVVRDECIKDVLNILKK
jgi:hypothetical protein